MRSLLFLAAALLLAAAPPAPAPVASDPAPPAVPADPSPPVRERRPPCPPEKEPVHCVYLTLRQPNRKVLAQVLADLEKDGIKASARENRELSLTAGDARLRELFGARMHYGVTGASASDRLICEARIVSIAPGPRYRQVYGARIDPACP